MQILFLAPANDVNEAGASMQPTRVESLRDESQEKKLLRAWGKRHCPDVPKNASRSLGAKHTDYDSYHISIEYHSYPRQFPSCDP
jgi:hypothetical protein